MDLAKDSENLKYAANTERNSEGSCVNLCNTDDAESLQPMSYKEKGKEKRSKSKVKDTTLKSLQPLSGSNNLSLINDLLRTKSERRRQKLMGLRAILEDLLAPKDGSGLPSGIMSFDREMQCFYLYFFAFFLKVKGVECQALFLCDVKGRPSCLKNLNFRFCFNQLTYYTEYK